jgi:hypothetical protein
MQNICTEHLAMKNDIIFIIIPLSPSKKKWYFWMVLHPVTLWTGAWEGGSGWGLGVPKFPLMVLQNGTFEWHLVTHSRSLCVKTYLLWFWLPPSFPMSRWTGRRSRAPTGDFTVAFGHGHPVVLFTSPQEHWKPGCMVSCKTVQAWKRCAKRQAKNQRWLGGLFSALLKMLTLESCNS